MSGEDAWLVLAAAARAGRAVAPGPRSLIHATGGRVNFRLVSPRNKRSRIKALLDEVGHHERQLRNAVAQLVELTEPGDDLHVECCRLLEQLD